MSQSTTELDGGNKERLRSFTCSECGELRNLLDFYDEEHEVYLTKDMTVYIDHGQGKRALEAGP